MASEGLKSLVKNTGFLTAAGVVNVAARMAYVILAARVLGPELYALLAYTQSFYLAFLPLALFGLHLVVVRRIGADPGGAREVAAGSLAVRLLTTTVSAALCVGAAWAIADGKQTRNLILVLVVALAARAATTWAQSIFNAFGVTHHTLRLTLVFSVLELALASGALLQGGGVLVLVTVHAAVWSVHALLALSQVNRSLVPLRVDWSAACSLSLATASIPFFLGSLATTWSMQGPIILFTHLAGGEAQIGQFVLAMQALLIVSVLPESLAASALPQLARSAGRADGNDLVFASGMLRLAILCGTAAGFAAMALGPWLFGSLFGASFVEAGTFFGIIAWCLIPMLVRAVLPVVIIARGYSYLPMSANLIGALVMTVLFFFLVPSRGVWGAILATAAGLSTPAMATIAFSGRRGWIRLERDVARPTVAVVSSLGAYFVIGSDSAWLASAAALALLAITSFSLGIFTAAERVFLTRKLFRR